MTIAYKFIFNYTVYQYLEPKKLAFFEHCDCLESELCAMAPVGDGCASVKALQPGAHSQVCAGRYQHGCRGEQIWSCITNALFQLKP